MKKNSGKKCPIFFAHRRLFPARHKKGKTGGWETQGRRNENGKSVLFVQKKHTLRPSESSQRLAKIQRFSKQNGIKKNAKKRPSRKSFQRGRS